jgi:hypothetical protein
MKSALINLKLQPNYHLLPCNGQQEIRKTCIGHQQLQFSTINLKFGTHLHPSRGLMMFTTDF